MTDSDLPPAKLAQVIPDTWIHHHEVSRPAKIIRIPHTDSVVVKKSVLNFPLPAWESLGKPTKITCFFHGLDTIIVPSTDIPVYVGNNWASVKFQNNTERFRPYLIPGIYGPERHRIDSIGGIRYLRIVGANFTLMNRKWLQHWKEQ